MLQATELKKQKLDESLMYLYHLAMYYEHRYTVGEAV